ncbi:MAG: hypothetical protein E7591_06425 [Ruminococcaceae bacterium]|nr:hypothetical protein [Oscillospiraceae bacterium]MBE6965059.1 hypothetical protein [Oscillospiraceae bacterium]
MKKLFIICFSILTLALSVTPAFANEYSWEEDFVAEIGRITLPEATPVIDGIINTGEGWSEAQYFDKTNTEGAWGGQTVDVSGNLYRAYDSEYFYIAADIKIPEYSLCEGEDWIEGDDVGDLPGWDGDVFILSTDPLQSLLHEGFGTDPAAWYCIGLFEGGEVRTYRTHVNKAEITDIVPAKGKTTEGGWLFEAAIPWDTICKDVDETSFGFVQITPEDIIKEGNVISASVIYYDRRYDPEAEQRITHSRYVTVATVFPDGTPGVVGTPWTIQAHGIFFVVDPKDQGPTDTNNDQKEPASPENNQNNGNQNTNNNSSKPQQSPTKPNSSASTNSASPQTVDLGIAVALGVLCVSSAGVIFIKKKKLFFQKEK